MKEVFKFILFIVFILGVSIWCIWYSTRHITVPVNTPNFEIKHNPVEVIDYEPTGEK